MPIVICGVQEATLCNFIYVDPGDWMHISLPAKLPFLTTPYLSLPYLIASLKYDKTYFPSLT